MKQYDDKAKRQQEMVTRAFAFFALTGLFVLITPVKRAEVYTVPESQGGNASLLRENTLTEGQKLNHALDILMEDDLRLEENNYPATMTFRWTGGTLKVQPGDKARHIAWTIFQYTEKSVPITLIVGEEKYYGYYNRE